jgi:DNA-binding XRE family transcriptional regulator
MDEPNAKTEILATPRIALQDCDALPKSRRNMTGEELKRIRLYNTELLGRYLRQEDFAEMIGVTRDTITRAETHGASRDLERFVQAAYYQGTIKEPPKDWVP